MQWLNLLGKLSPERVQPILREGQCKPVSDNNTTPNMASDHHDSPPEQFAADDQDESSSIGGFSLLAPPLSLRQPHDYSGLQPGPHQLHSLLDDLETSHDPPAPPATTLNLGSAAASSGPMRAVTHLENSDDVSLPNPHSLSPQTSWVALRAPPPIVPQRAHVSRGGYAPADALPPQNYIPPARTVPSSSAPFFPPGSRGTSIFTQAQGATPSNPTSPTALVPLNSELARPPRFTFAPPGADVPADPVTSPMTASPTSPRNWRDKARARLDKSSQQPTQERPGGRARSNSWSVVSVFRRRSGRQPGPAPLTTDAPPQLAPSDWRDLAQWAYRTTDYIWGETFASHVDIPQSLELEAGPSSYERSLPPLPSHLSHLPVPSAPLMRTDSSKSTLNPFLVHRPVGPQLPPLSWDLRTAAHAILFPASGPGMPAVPMAASDYAQPATWPPCGALRIGAVSGHTRWRWPVEAHNPAGVRCGDVFRALVANLHAYVWPHELDDMPPDRVAIVAALCGARIATSGTSSHPGWPSAEPDGIRRVDCLLGCTWFQGLEPGPSAGEWTLYVGAS